MNAVIKLESGTGLVHELPWLEKVKTMADTANLMSERNQLENRQLWELAESRNEVILMCLAFHYGWGLSFNGKLNTFVAALKNNAEDTLKAYSFLNPINDRSDPGLRLCLWKTEFEIKHRFMFQLGVINPNQTAGRYAASLSQWSQKLLYQNANKLDQLFKDQNTTKIIDIGWCIRHEIIQ